MQIRCPHCSRDLRVPDELLGKQVRCKSCSQTFAAAPETQEDDSRLTWRVQTGEGEQYGPVTKAELDQWVAESRLDSECQVLREDWNQWQWADEIFPQLNDEHAAPAAEANVPTSASEPPAAPRPKPKVPTKTATPLSPSTGDGAKSPGPSAAGAAPTPNTASQKPAADASAPTGLEGLAALTAPEKKAVNPAALRGLQAGAAPASRVATRNAATKSAPNQTAAKPLPGVPTGSQKAPRGVLPKTATAPAASNPYSAPGDPGAAGGFSGSDRVAAELRQTRPWIIFIMVLSLITPAVWLALSLAAIVFSSPLAGLLGTLAAVVAALPGYFMFRYQAAIGTFLRQRDEGSAVAAMAAQKRMWLAAGVFALLGIISSLLMFGLGLGATAIPFVPPAMEPSMDRSGIVSEDFPGR